MPDRIPKSEAGEGAMLDPAGAGERQTTSHAFQGGCRSMTQHPAPPSGDVFNRKTAPEVTKPQRTIRILRALILRGGIEMDLVAIQMTGIDFYVAFS
jgi:hypothetical protein